MQGPPGMSGYEIVQKTQEFSVLAAPQVSTGFGTVACPAGKVVVSGGYSIAGQTPGGVIVTASYPESGAWKVSFQNAGKTAANFTVELYAVCVYVE